VERHNQAETLINSTEKSLSEHGDKVSEEEKKTIEDAISDLKTELDADSEGNNEDEITKKIEALAQASMKLGEAMYKASQEAEASAAEGAAAEGGDDASQESSDDKVVDADFEEVNDDKKNPAE
jgi:molecular chaperone DnaK